MFKTVISIAIIVWIVAFIYVFVFVFVCMCVSIYRDLGRALAAGQAAEVKESSSG